MMEGWLDNHYPDDYDLFLTQTGSVMTRKCNEFKVLHDYIAFNVLGVTDNRF